MDSTADSVTSAGTFVTAAPGSYISSTAAAAAVGAASGDGAAAGGVEAVSAVSLLLPGLRVRMGVASGMLGDKEDCLNCKVLEVARGEYMSSLIRGKCCWKFDLDLVIVLKLPHMCLHECRA